jgi:hypothetical protein
MGLGVTAGGWRYAAASVIGTSHLTSADGVCQDYHGVHFVESINAFVGIVSDGAGSASQSQIGARRTCDFLLEKISEAPLSAVFSKSFASTALEQLRLELQNIADESGLALRDFACTMLVAIVAREKAAFWQIGDGAICFRERDKDRFGYAFWPEKGDYANVTFFVTDQNAQGHLDFDVVDAEFADLAMFSDGLERLALDFVTSEAHTAFFEGLFPYVRSLPESGYSGELSSQIEAFLATDRVNKRTDDDKTLILASHAI